MLSEKRRRSTQIKLNLSLMNHLHLSPLVSVVQQTPGCSSSYLCVYTVACSVYSVIIIASCLSCYRSRRDPSQNTMHSCTMTLPNRWSLHRLKHKPR